MTKEHLLQLLDQKGAPDLTKIRTWVNQLPNTHTKIQPIAPKPGDIFMHPTLVHPYVLLEQHNNYWICGLLTSNNECAEILEPCRSRFYPNSYWTTTLLTYTYPHGKFLSTYENPNHLRSILNKLRNRLNPPKTH